jgi:hypothetical protein
MPQVITAFSVAAHDTLPNVGDLIQHRMARRTDSEALAYEDGLALGGENPPSPAEQPADAAVADLAQRAACSIWSLGKGAGARRLSEVSCRAAIQLLVVQACGEVYARSCSCMPPSSVVVLLDILRQISGHAADVDADIGMRHSLLLAQAADKVRGNIGTGPTVTCGVRVRCDATAGC